MANLDLDTARKIVALENEAKDLVTKLAKVSHQLQILGYDIKLAAWDWERPGYISAIMPQGRIHLEIINKDDRPCSTSRT